MSVVVYDLDGTLTRSDTFVQFLALCLRTHPWRLLRCLHLPIAYLMFKIGLKSNGWLKQVFLVAIVGGMDHHAMDRLVQRHVDQTFASNLKAAATVNLENQVRKGMTTVLASASPDLYVREIGRRLNFDAVFCTQIRWEKGRCKGVLEGGNLYGQAKLDALVTGYPDIELAYSDHHADLPLLQYAKQGVLVDPDPKTCKLVSNLNLETVEWAG